MTWVVTLTYDIEADVDTMVEWGDALDPKDASIANIPGSGVDVTVWIDDAPDPFKAQELAARVARSVLRAEPVGVEAVHEKVYEKRADAPTLPEMVSAPEVGDMLGVSRQRVYQLQQTGSFPEPLYRLRTGPVWDARAIDAFAGTWSRRPGPKARAS